MGCQTMARRANPAHHLFLYGPQRCPLLFLMLEKIQQKNNILSHIKIIGNLNLIVHKKVLLVYSHSPHLYTVYGCFHAAKVEMSNFDRNCLTCKT